MSDDKNTEIELMLRHTLIEDNDGAPLPEKWQPNGLLDEIELLQAAIGRHFRALHSVVPWTAVIVNDDGDLQTVEGLYVDDHVVVRKEADR